MPYTQSAAVLAENFYGCRLSSARNYNKTQQFEDKGIGPSL